MDGIIKFDGKDIDVKKDTKGNLSLNDLYKLSGTQPSKDPRHWIKLDSTEALIDALANALDVGKSDIINVQRGRGKVQGTYAHKSIWLAYAKYLDPRLHLIVNQVFFERIEEDKNPDLTIDRGIAGYKKKGKSDEWISERIKGKATRNAFTGVLAKHGVEHEGFRNATNAIYIPLFGGTTSVVREKKGLAKSDNIRDNLSPLEISAIGFAEALASEIITKNNLQGNAKCEIASGKSGKIVADAVKSGMR